jgi:ribosomal protein RSM22 (predicted rRNA methylase)
VAGSGPAAGSLTRAIQAGLTGTGIPSLAAGVQRLMAAYRSGEVPASPVMASRADAAAYAAYRMPATVAASAVALREVLLSLPDWRPSSLLDFGAGTGGCAWAAAGELADLRAITLLEQSADAIRLGEAIFAGSGSHLLQSARWRPWRLSSGEIAPPAGPADVATAAYVLGELTPAQQAALVALAMAAAPAVLLVEPGTPAGHRRILTARDQLLAAGYRIAAPCPLCTARSKAPSWRTRTRSSVT